MPDTNSNRFDKELRGKATRYRKEPTDQVWQKLQAGLGKPAPRKNYRLAGLVLLGFLLLLVGNLLPRLSELSVISQPVSKAENLRETTLSAGFSGVSKPAEEKGAAIASEENTLPQIQKTTSQKRETVAGVPLPQKPEFKPNTNRSLAENPVVETSSEAEAGFVAAHQPLVQETAVLPLFAGVNTSQKTAAKTEFPVVLHPLIATESEIQKLAVAASPEAAENAALIRALEAQKHELKKLQFRTDSLLALYLPEPAENQSFPLLSDSLPQTKPKSRWSAALALAPELNFMHLSAPASDTLLELRRNHESGRAGASAAISLEYQLSKKLRIGAGIGYSAYGAELRLTNTQTLLDVRYDTTTQVTTQHYTNTHTNYIVQQDSTAVMDPIFNQSGQVIGYNTVYVTHPDTTWHTVTVEGTDTVRVQTITPLIHQSQKTTYRKLKPQYHFVTLPVMLHYRLTAGNRWWAEAGVGGQLQFFRGGTQLVTEDGRTYYTERVGPNEGPFRPVNFALMGNLAVNYGLTERLLLSVAPAMRWQVQSVYKKETGLKQKPLATGVQFGLRYSF